MNREELAIFPSTRDGVEVPQNTAPGHATYLGMKRLMKQRAQIAFLIGTAVMW